LKYLVEKSTPAKPGPSEKIISGQSKKLHHPGKAGVVFIFYYDFYSCLRLLHAGFGYYLL
jgi:hypothetical protein